MYSNYNPYSAHPSTQSFSTYTSALMRSLQQQNIPPPSMTSSISKPSTSDVISGSSITPDNPNVDMKNPLPRYPSFLTPFTLNNQGLPTASTAAYPHFFLPSIPLTPFITPHSHPITPTSSSIEQDARKLFDYLSFFKSADTNILSLPPRSLV